jgi:hypothetical protein
MQQNITRTNPRGNGNGFDDEPRTRNAQRAHKRNARRGTRSDRRNGNKDLRRMVSVGDYANWL